MCGFTAIVGDPGRLNSSIGSILYRGFSDRVSKHSEKDIHIAHVRLPIVDLSSGGNQPARRGNQIGFLVGEIFNFRQFSDASTDTQAILDSFFLFGTEGFHSFDGFWNFITIVNNKLLVVGDYLSQKPIYYRTDIKAIASEPIALHAYGPVTNDEIFYSNIKKWNYDMTGRTPWSEIKQLPPGHLWLDGEIKPYWNWNLIPVVTVQKAVTEAMQNRLLGDQPITCLLSGGLDSSIVFLLAKKLGADIKSFHIENEESDFAKLVDPNTECLPLEGLPYSEALRYHQSPVDLGSVHPQAILAEAIHKKGYHVCLTGDGADELFGGYGRSDKYDSQMSDVFVELPYYHLPRLDRLMMRKTIELRTPFLAPTVIKAAMNIPSYDRKSKAPLKMAFADLLPEAILRREKKALKTLRVKTGGLKLVEDNIKIFKGLYK